jgi:hypothetical protein
MQFLQILTNNWRLFAFIGGITLSALVGYNAGANSVQSRWEATVSKMEKVAIEKERNINTASNIIDRDLQDAQNSFNDDYNSYIDELYATSSTVSKVNTTSKYNATSCNDGLSTKDKAYIAKLANDADKQVEQLTACQLWIKQVTK